jgi:putative transposase
MPYNPDLHHRKSHRLRGHDYTEPGQYFVTLCTHDMTCLFGDIIHGQMEPNLLGQIVMAQWLALPSHFPNLNLDAWQLMPNHLHGILILTSTPPSMLQTNNRLARGYQTYDSPQGTASGSLGAIIQSLKKTTTRKIRRLTNDPDIQVWHRDYHDHIIRDHDDLLRVRHYIAQNPVRWELRHNSRDSL